MDQVLTRLEALETRLEGPERRGDYSHTQHPPSTEFPDATSHDSDLLFDDLYLRNRRDKGAVVSEFNVDSGGGPYPLDFNHSRGQDSGSRRGAFMGHHHRTLG